MLVALIVLISVAAGVYFIVRSRQPARPSTSATPGSDAAQTAATARKECDPALYEAAAHGDAAKVGSLLQGGADPALRNAERISPLGAAIANGHGEVVHVLIAAGVDPNAPTIEDQPALLVAASYLRTSIAADLIKSGAAVDFSHPTIGTALAVAIVKGDRETAELLLRAGVPIELRNAGGARALHVAALMGNKELTELLIAKGAGIHCPNFQGGTPLRSAAANGHTEIVQLLLAAGADPSPLDHFEKRPVDYAREAGHTEVTRILENAKSPSAGRQDCPTENSLALMLPARQDATLQTVIQAREQGMELLNAAASSLEAPSMIASVRSVLGPSFKVACSVDGESDPRLPIRPVDFVLWTYGASNKLTNDAKPAVPQPPQSVADEVALVAEYPYLLSSWSSAAAKAAHKLRPEHMEQVLAVMVHPPSAPKYIEPWDWYFRVEVAAALIASHLGGEPWATARRRMDLEDVLDGPADWTSTAAVIALLDVARRDDAARPLVVNALLRTARRPENSPAYQHAIRPAALAILELPGVAPEVLKEMKDLIKDE